MIIFYKTFPFHLFSLCIMSPTTKGNLQGIVIFCEPILIGEEAKVKALERPTSDEVY